MIGKFHLPISAGGSLPDPATYCTANGYILNPINPADGWNLLCEFQTNSPNTTTFDPVITSSSGEYAWDLGDGTILVGDKIVSHTYLTTATRTVKLYGKGTCTITAVDWRGDNIVGELDVSNSVFSTVTSWNIQQNVAMTNVLFPSTITAAVSVLSIYGNDLTGVIDLSMFTSFSTSTTTIDLDTNQNLTGVTFASSVTGKINYLYFHTCNITGVFDLSMFTSLTNTAAIYVHTNPNLTGVTFASSITGLVLDFRAYSTAITGTLDLSMFTSFTSAATVHLHTNPNLTGVTFASSTITGIIKFLYLYSCSSLGYVDITKLKTGIGALDWRFQNNLWDAAIVNHVLSDTNGISASGFAGRIIDIGGTNIDPDTTSGGYDGVTARNSLIAKGFTVTIT